MWSLFSRDPSSGFGYEILDYCPGLEDRSIWKLHKAKKKGTGEEFSVFVFDLKSTSEPQAQVAKSAYKRMKTLRHPNILTYIDGLETDKVLYVVTQPVVPLITYLNQFELEGSRNELAISWGIHQVLKALIFLIKDCHLIHNNVCLTSVYVNKAGEWLLGGLEYIYPSTGEQSVPPIKIMPLLEKYDPPEKANQKLTPTNEWSRDMWGLGCLIWEAFNGLLNKPSDLKNLGKLPKTITGGYATLVGANPKSRPNPQTFLTDCRREGAFLGNKFVDSMMFLEEIQIKDQNQKKEFLESLSTEIDSFPASFSKHKILPQLIKAFEFGDAGAHVLTPLLKVGKLLEQDEYQTLVVPCVVKMFNLTDRQTRVKLLQQMNLYIEYIPINIVNEQLFPSISLGFNDTNPLVRETTIKAMLHLASKLNYKNLNEELMKHFARLQAKDDQGGIRTNTTVCLGKISSFLHPQIRQKVLPSAFTRGLKDPFPPARQAALLAMQTCVGFFPIQELAFRLLPSLCQLTRDPEKSVRDQVFSAIEVFLGRLKKVSDDPECLVELEKDVTSTTSCVPDTQSWSGWAMNAGITSLSTLSTLTSKLKVGQSVPGASTAEKKTPDATSHPEEQVKQPEVKRLEPLESKASILESADDGWGNDWEDDPQDWNQMSSSKPDSKLPKKSAWDEPANDDWGSGWDDKADELAEEDEGYEPIEASREVVSASSYNWDSHSKVPSQQLKPDDFFNSFQNSKTIASRSTKDPVKETPESSAWGDGDTWGSSDDWGTDAGRAASPSIEERKKEREEKKQERQKALAEKKAAKPAGKAMKLGTKKPALD